MTSVHTKDNLERQIEEDKPKRIWKEWTQDKRRVFIGG
jgi:hypothetical protein